MKSKKLSKKIFSAIAVLAVSATAIGGALSVLNRNDKASTVDSSNDRKTVVVDTALGQTRSSIGKIYYAGPEAKSNDATNDGTMEHPFNLGDILTNSIDTKLEAGDTLYVLPGLYKSASCIRMSRTAIIGTFDKYIRIVNASMERDKSGYTDEGTQCLLDFSQQSFGSTERGVQIDTDYIYWLGIDVCGAGDNGLYIGGSYNTVEYCEFYNNRDTGLQLGRSYSEYTTIKDWPSYNLVKDCTSHNNYDNETFGENADGFAAKLTVGYGNVFDGCIAYRNSDDGWDLYAKTDSGNIGTVIMYNCVAFENGYLEYTRDECNSLFPTYDKTQAYETAETSENPYMTRDGDGNGFKLGGSIMEGDVILYNCLSYNNRMHGVTDNSNPGYIKSTYVTSYNNSAMVDEYGNIAAVANVDLHSNIDVSRQIYSYNALNNVLSVRDENAKSLDKDNYRGTVVNSFLDATSKTNVINGAIEGDTINGGTTFVSQMDLIDSATMFKSLPNQPGTLNGLEDSMIIEVKEVDGKQVGTVTALKDSRVHIVYRNEDHSINMHDILAKSDEGEELIASKLGEGVTIGSDLNKTSWNEYTHFYENDLVNGSAESAAKSVVERVKEALTLNCDEDAVFQDFEVPTEMINAKIEWTSLDEEIIVHSDNVSVSGSDTKYIIIEVDRPYDADKKVTLNATITYEGATETKVFELILKKGTPSVGEIYVQDQNGNLARNGEKLIVDMYNAYNEPNVKVKNGMYPDSNKLLSDETYNIDTKYVYQTNANANKVEINTFTPSVAGVYTITHNVSIKGETKSQSMTYQIFVASTSATVEFIGEPNVTVNRNGFNISGEPSSATGTIYTLSSTTEINDLTATSIKMQANVVSYDFRDTSISFNFVNANTDSYYVYFALANANGEITSKLYSVLINKVDIDDTSKFITMAGGKKIGDEVPSQTIYALTKNLDFKDVSFELGSGKFEGLFNGLGHTLSNMSTTNQGFIYKVAGGTIMNVKFDNMSITSSSEKIGLVVECSGGEFYNLAFTNVNVGSGGKRVAALIGHVGDTDKKGSDIIISQVSIVNDADHKIVGAQRVGGLIGYVQAYEHVISIDNCYIVTDIEASTTGEGGGMVAAWEDRAGDTLIIKQCYYSGLLKTGAKAGSSRLGGMLGYHKGGAGVLTIDRCISFAQFHIEGNLMENAVKNASSIIGGYSGALTTVVNVNYCYASFPSYNANYDVTVYSERNFKRDSEYLTGEYALALDLTRWTIVKDDNPEDERDLYKAPYVVLNFLGDWN